MQLYSVSLTKSLNHVISKIRQIGKKKSVSFFDAYPFVCHLQYNKWESCSSSAKKYTRGSFLDKISNGCLKNGNSLASAWHNPTVSRCRVTETPGATWSWRLRNYTLQTYRLLCNVTEYRRFEPFFFFHFFLFPECVILEIGISSDIIRWLADCVGVYFLLIFFFNHIMRPNIWFAKEKKPLTECFICAWAFKKSNLKNLDIYNTYMNMNMNM